MYRLAHEGKPYFLSRPRRFGKSLLVSTLKAYWEGKRELFGGLAVEALEEDGPDAWQPHPIFHFDFNGQDYQQEGALEAMLDLQLKQWEQAYGLTEAVGPLGSRFEALLITACAQTGRRCVVLVDEYDKPLLEVMEDHHLEKHNRSVFKGFFSVLKKADEHLQFVFITGVTKFSKVSIFSDLSQLRDISLSEDFADVCGVTERELLATFGPEIERLATRRKMSHEECVRALRGHYDGYCFHPDGPNGAPEGEAVKVYNPFSLLSALVSKELGSYWFESETPTFLVRRMHASGFDPRRLVDGTIRVTRERLLDYRAEDTDFVPLLYQTGYLTIASFDERRRRYTLVVPNGEVEYGLLERLAPEYAPSMQMMRGTDIFSLDDRIESGDLEGIRDILAALFAGIPYTQEGDPFEHYFQAVIWLVFTLLGRYVGVEMHSATGRVDCIVETEDFVYLFEFKRDGTAGEALSQIDERGYALPFAADPRTLWKVGCTFDSKTRLLAGWKVR